MAGSERRDAPPRSGPLTVLTERRSASPPCEGGNSSEDALAAALGAAGARGGFVLFAPGTRDLDDLQTLAGLALLRRAVSRRASGAPLLLVVAASPLVLRAASEILAGQPDALVVFVSGDPAGAAAGAAALVRREAPGAVILAGAYSAEALLPLAAAAAAGSFVSAGSAGLGAAALIRLGADRPIAPERLWDALLPGVPEGGAASVRYLAAGLLLAAAATAAGALVATLRAPAWERLVDSIRAALGAGP